MPAVIQVSPWEVYAGITRFTLSGVLRAGKAALLVCDRVHLANIAHWCALTVAHGWQGTDGVGRFGESTGDASEWMRRYGDFDADAEFVFGTMFGPVAVPGIDGMLLEVQRGVDAGVFDLRSLPTKPWFVIAPDASAGDHAKLETAPAARTFLEREGFVASCVLAHVPVFPDAELDVLLDVRDRLGPQRSRLAGAVASMASELRDVDDSEFMEAAHQLVRRDVHPAAAEIDAVLGELGALPTLLRLGASREVAAAAAASVLTLAATRYGHADLPALAQGLAATPTAVGAAREALIRRRLLRIAGENRFALISAKLVRRMWLA